MKTVYIETSIPSYLTARASADVKSTTWQLITKQWWLEESKKYELFISDLVIAEASRGNIEASKRRISSLDGLAELSIEPITGELANNIIAEGGMPKSSEADAIHVALCAVHHIDYLLTWNCRHINNAITKPVIRDICKKYGFSCPEICTPLELLYEV
jgi:predicted nucleic acid-binding protein